VVDSNVIDVGYSGVIGADRIADGDQLYGKAFSRQVQTGDTYGPVTYLAYLPFEQAMPWSGEWDDLPAAHGAAIAFDLLVLAGLIVLGRRLRAGPEGRRLGLALAYAWAAYPYTAFALESNSNDTLVALALVGAMLALTSTRGPGRAALGRGVALGLGAAAKFVPDGGLSEVYDRTLAYQAGRSSPFSIWGQHASLDWLQAAVNVGALALAVAVAFLPRRRDAVQVAALAAAVVIALQLGVTHWFYLYVVWFTPLILVAVMAPVREPVTEKQDGSPRPPRETAEHVAA
jgi:hypothetical protein